MWGFTNWLRLSICAALLVSLAVMAGCRPVVAADDPDQELKIQQWRPDGKARTPGVPATYDVICAEPGYHDNADLCQQWRSANAAVEVARWAVWQTWFTGLAAGFGGITVFGLIWTLLLTQRSTKAAVASAKAAERMLDEHERPWIFRHGVQVRWLNRPNVASNDWSVALRWKNVGRSPAVIESLHYKIADKNFLGPVPDFTGALELPVVDALSVDEHFDTQEVSLGNPYKILKDAAVVQYVFYGFLKYREMNGRVRESRFAIELNPFASGAGSFEGNEYNKYL